MICAVVLDGFGAFQDFLQETTKKIFHGGRMKFENITALMKNFLSFEIKIIQVSKTVDILFSLFKEDE